MPRKVELLSGGVVTDRDPMLLKPGQLAAVRNMVYKNGAVGLERAPGRDVFGAVSAVATGVVGLRDIHFDNGDHYLVGMAGAKYRLAPVGDTGTFSDLADITAGTSLEVVQYRNRFFLMNGASSYATGINSNLVAYMSATAAGTTLSTRSPGLLPVVAAPTVATASGAFSQSVTGYYEYWTTEVARITQDGATLTLESAFSSDSGVTTVLVATTAQVPVISRPPTMNALTTNWRIYRSPKKDFATDKKFPTGFMVAELSTSTAATAHRDQSTVASATSFAASANSGSFYADFASASSMFADDGVYASATTPATPPVLTSRDHIVNIGQGLYSFNFAAFTGNITGIVVEVQGYVSSGSAPVPILVSIGTRAANGRFREVFPPSKSGYFVSTNSGAPTTLSLGSTSDNWNLNAYTAPGLVDTTINSNLMVTVSVSQTGVSIGVDYVKVYLYYGASVDSTVVYPTVVYTFGDIVSQVSKNFPPPSSNTGDIFQDSLVVNDMSNRSLLRFSFPGEVESFPPTYYLDFETRENDVIQHIRVVNNRLVVGLDTSIWRVNYLPSERDATFDRGNATEMISRSFGIVGPMCACTFTIDGQSEQLAFVSHKGIHTTDGYNFITRTKNQTWRNYISLTATSYPIALLNDPENRCLRFFYRNDDMGDETYLCLWLSYDVGDIDAEGSFKASGPVHMRNYDGTSYASVESAWAVPRAGGNTGIYIGYGGTATGAGAGKVYRETGTTIPAKDSASSWTSRRIYGGGLTGEWMLDDLYGYCGTYTGSPLLTYTFSATKTNDHGILDKGSKSITLRGAKLHKVTPKVMGEGIQISMRAEGDQAFGQELVVFGSTDYGREDAGT